LKIYIQAICLNYFLKIVKEWVVYMKFFVYLGSKFEFLEEKFFRENQNTHFTFTLYVVYFVD
jgi:hypothetical protein